VLDIPADSGLLLFGCAIAGRADAAPLYPIRRIGRGSAPLRGRPVRVSVVRVGRAPGPLTRVVVTRTARRGGCGTVVMYDVRDFVSDKLVDRVR
jgi:hypothetical protein